MINDTQKSLRVPHDSRNNYSKDTIAKRVTWLSQQTGVKLDHLTNYKFDPEEARGNVENFVGVAQIPIGIVGPLLIEGEHAQGIFYIPFATTEGALVTTYSRGALAITKSGGARVVVHCDENHLDPSFHVRELKDAKRLASWVTKNFQPIKEIAERTTEHGKLLRIIPHIIGRRVVLDFAYETADAMGANMINIATEDCCEFISQETGFEDYFLRSNFSSEKKTSGAQLVVGCGRSVTAEAILPKRVVERYLDSSPEKLGKGWYSWALASVNAGMLGFNAQFSNGLAAIYIACGQDVAHVTNGSVGMTMFEVTDDGDLYAAVKLPNIIVGTVGGGTALSTQRECLEMIGCHGKGKAKKFAEIVGAALLAGEIGLCAGLTSKDFLAPHKLARAYTREKAYQQQANTP